MRKYIFPVVLWLAAVSCSTVTNINHQSLNQFPAALLGNFKDDYGSTYFITNTTWVQDKRVKYHLLQYNKKQNYFIAKNDEANPSDGGLYSRIDIIYFGKNELWHWGYCLTAYKANTIQEAMNSTADRANPRNGCNGYPFSRMKQE